jgi:hypothetical protein
MPATLRASCRRSCAGCTLCVLPLALLKLLGRDVPFISALDMTVDQLGTVERALRNHFADLLRLDFAAMQAAVRAASALPHPLPARAFLCVHICCAHRNVHSRANVGLTSCSRAERTLSECIAEAESRRKRATCQTGQPAAKKPNTGATGPTTASKAAGKGRKRATTGKAARKGRPSANGAEDAQQEVHRSRCAVMLVSSYLVTVSSVAATASQRCVRSRAEQGLLRRRRR